MEEYRILPRVNYPADLKNLTPEELWLLSEELRHYLITTIKAVGGHFATNLGVVELAVALHRVYDTPRDRLVWDVGHQSYAHKVLTGRRDRLPSIRQHGGLSGFCKITESEYDAFGAGHASTSVAAAMGMAVARDRKGENFRVIAVIGDGAMTGGLAYEALNNAGMLGTDITVILNDNKMSISPNVGALHRYLTVLTSSPAYNKTKQELLRLLKKIPAVGDGMEHAARYLDDHLKNLVVPGSFFGALGFKYYGPIDGHDLPLLVHTLENLKDAKGPVLLHVVTTKGKGDEQAEIDSVKFHGITAMPKPGAPAKPKDPNTASWSEVYGKSLAAYADSHPGIVAISAAMREGTGLDHFDMRHPGRFYDVGIAEAYAVTFAAGLAREGMRPFATVYSTFLQRAYDQLVHDVAIQHLPVVFCLDRAGLVGADGPTHHGALDLSYLRCVQGMVVAAPKDGDELYDLMNTALEWKDGPFALRYPRGNTKVVDYGREPRPIAVGSWEVLTEGAEIAILGVGTMVETALKTADALAARGYAPCVVNARFVKPLDSRWLKESSKRFRLAVTLEDNVVAGGFGEAVLHHISDAAHAAMPRVEVLGLPDRFIEHGERDVQMREIGLAPEQVSEKILAWAAELGIAPRKKAAEGSVS
jgi:1-deoxy-D-xylulose-5-phosphate synthase